jgi:hypothetical protein
MYHRLKSIPILGRLWALASIDLPRALRLHLPVPPTANEREVLQLLDEYHISDPILLCGYQKSGNTWLRFLIFNYFNILRHGATDTLTYQALNTIQCQEPNIPKTVVPIQPGFPPLFRTHKPYRPIFNHFRLIYIYRHPLDTLISYYYWMRAKGQYSTVDIDEWVLGRLNHWINHYKRTRHKAMTVVTYEALKAETYGVVSSLLSTLGYEVDSIALQRSVEISSFESIQRMGRETGQLTGNSARKNFRHEFEFTRSGKIKQYENELQPATIKQARIELRSHGIRVAW